MTIPTAPLFPNKFDSELNLYLAHDALRLRLADDYHPGDRNITVEGDVIVLLKWPQTGLLTLTEQCSDLDKRAISFFYNGVDTTNGIIQNLEILPLFVDGLKPKTITDVTMNVMADHHNNIKEALIAIEGFVGIKGTIDTEPFGPTLEGRINFLRKVVLVPRAWFSSDLRAGIVPLDIEFHDMSFRLGTDGTAGPVIVTWDFGDGNLSTISLSSGISGTDMDGDEVVVYNMIDGKIKKTYLTPGIFDVSLTVQNDFGSDTVVFPDYIKAHVQAPNVAVIQITQATGQLVTPGSPSGGPYDVVPRIRSPINTLINLDILPGENPATLGYSYVGELLNEAKHPLDPVTTYTWALGDDLNHSNSPSTKGSYGVGGIYNLILRVDTEFGAYRITEYNNSIDIVENYNLWLWIFTDTVHARSYEYGLISETFKTSANSSLAVTKNDTFLNAVPNYTVQQQKREFAKNNGFAPISTANSGNGGSALLYWSAGRNISDPIGLEHINVVEYNGFSDTYLTRNTINRPWNWCALNSSGSAYFVFGTPTSSGGPNTSPTNALKTTLDLVSGNVSSNMLAVDNFENGAQELLQNPAVYYTDPPNSGQSIYGDFSVYRTAWKDNTGYIARNDGIGPFFRIKSFYRTEGTVGFPFINIRKLTDIQGVTKLEGELTNLSQGIYFFNNSGSISQFNDTTSVWLTGGPGVNSVAYRALQDTSVLGFDDASNTLLCASDKDHRAYLSFDYSSSGFLKFSEIDTTFKTLGSRPEGEQWVMAIY